MTLREFADPNGVSWCAWEVRPGQHHEWTGGRDWPPLDRRAGVRDEYAGGWLAFECSSERRRLAPVPDGWSERSDKELCTLCDQATVVGRPRRLAD